MPTARAASISPPIRSASAQVTQGLAQAGPAVGQSFHGAPWGLPHRQPKCQGEEDAGQPDDQEGGAPAEELVDPATQQKAEQDPDLHAD
jgi:hypothetical protein